MKRRPTGITLIGIVYIILGILSLLWSGLVLGVGGFSALFGGLFGAENVAAFGASSGIAGFVGIITAIVQIVTGGGLLALKRWAWYLALVAVGLTVITGILGLFGGGLFAFLCGGLGLIIPIIILIYLLRDPVRAAFGVSGV